jgi:hypothetical protein
MKSLLLLPMLLLAVLFSGCKKEEVVVPNRTIFINVPAANWQRDNDNKLFFVDLDVPEINDVVADRDGIIVAIAEPNGNVYEALPDVFHGFSISYTYQPGNVQLISQFADGTMPNNPPGDLDVKITIVESQQ